MSNFRMLASLLLGVALVAAVLLAVNFWPSGESPLIDPGLEPLEPLPTPEEPRQPPMPVPEVSDAAPAAVDAPAVDDAPDRPSEAQVAEPAPLPPLDESDAFVRAQTNGICLPLAWTVAESLVRRAAILIENAGRGELPPKRGGLLPPSSAFPVRREGDRLFMDESGYRRFDVYMDELEAIDPERLADCILLLGPLLDQALSELGYSDGPQAGVAAAIERILAVPEPIGDLRIELVQPKVLFQYSDPRLESLSGLQKQVLRMGPENTRRLKAYVSLLLPLLGDSPLD